MIRKSHASILILAAAMFGGCQAKPQAKPIVQQPTEADESAAALDQATDPCALRLQDIIGQLLAYYALYHQMPAKLEDLKPLADAGMDTTYACPESKEPYVYLGEGVEANGLRDRLMVYDKSAVHHGVRWAITMKPPVAGQIQMFVIPMNQKLMNAYLAGK